MQNPDRSYCAEKAWGGSFGWPKCGQMAGPSCPLPGAREWLLGPGLACENAPQGLINRLGDVVDIVFCGDERRAET